MFFTNFTHCLQCKIGLLYLSWKVYGSLELYIWTQNNYVEDNDASIQAKCIVFHHIIAHIA